MRPICNVDNCHNLAMYKGRMKSGKSKFRKMCQTHYRKEKGIIRNRFQDIEIIEMSKRPCARCGWNESYCDRHRIIPASQGGKYNRDNVIPLCPNCHRLET